MNFHLINVYKDTAQIKNLEKEHENICFKPDYTKKNWDSILRRMIEHKRCKYVVDLEYVPRVDYMNRPALAFNHVLAKLSGHLTVLISFESFLKSKNKSRTLARIRKLLRICDKYNVKVKCASFSPNDALKRTDEELAIFLKVISRRVIVDKKYLNSIYE